MFNSIRGTITEKSDGLVFLLSSGGIEWEVAVSSRTSRSLPEPGHESRLFVYLYHREDMMKLYGFAEESERSVFLDLLKVSGIGPRQAVKILSGIGVKDFVAHLEAGDAESLSTVQGLGKKTAQKIILTLKGKLQLQAEEDHGDRFRDVVQALSEMGYDRRDCSSAVQKILAEDDIRAMPESEREKEVFRRAIVMLSS